METPTYTAPDRVPDRAAPRSWPIVPTALAALAIAGLTVISPVTATAVLAAAMLSVVALVDVSALLAVAVALSMALERTRYANTSVSLGGIDLYPNDLLVGALSAAVLFVAARSGRVPALPRDRISLTVAAFLIYGLFSTVRSLGLHGWAAVLGFRIQYFYALLFPLTLWALRSERGRRGLLIAVLAAAVATGLQAIANVATDSPVGDLTGSRTARYLSGLQALVLFFATVLLAAVHRRVGRAPALALGALYVSGILVSQARSIWLGGLVAIGFVTLATRGWRGFARSLMIGAAVSLLLVGGFVATGALERVPVVGEVTTRMTSFSELDQDATAIWRLVVWGEALLALRADPILGLGLGKPFVYFDSAKGEFDDDRQLHNSYLELAYYTGFLGAALLIAFQVFVLQATLRAARTTRNRERSDRLRALAACQVALAAVAFTNVIGASMTATTWSWILAGASMAEARAARILESDETP